MGGVMKDDRTKEDLNALSTLLDSKFQGPFGIRFGLDAIIGLVPGVGDFITSALSIYIIAQAASLGVSSATLLRMSFNVIFENLVDMIPVLGNFFDFYWKANTMNMKLLSGHMANPSRETIRSKLVVGLVAGFLFAVLALSAYVTFQIILSIYFWLVSLGTD